MPFEDVFTVGMRISRAQAIALAERHLQSTFVLVHPRAVGALRTDAGWTVAFRPTRRSAWGRAVAVDSFGVKVRLQPRELDLTLPGLCDNSRALPSCSRY
jgi:hypothetical protein